MEDKPEKDNLLDILREAGYEAHDFLPGETLPEFIVRTRNQEPEN
jgi:hypothetical protein